MKKFVTLLAAVTIMAISSFVQEQYTSLSNLAGYCLSGGRLLLLIMMLIKKTTSVQKYSRK